MKNIYSTKFEEKLLESLKERRNEVCAITPQNIGILTPWYKKITAPLKRSPWKILLPVSLLLSFVGQLFLGPWSTKIVSVLQASF